MSEWVEIPDEATFDQCVMRAATPVFVAFETDDCRYCWPQRHLLTRAWRQLNWSVPTVRVDAQRLPAVAEAHGILGYPTVAVFFGGRVVKRYPGRHDAADLTRRLDSLLSGPGAGAGPAARHTPRAVTPPARYPAAVASSPGGSR